MSRIDSTDLTFSGTKIDSGILTFSGTKIDSGILGTIFIILGWLCSSTVILCSSTSAKCSGSE